MGLGSSLTRSQVLWGLAQFSGLSKQSRKGVDLPLTCYPSPILTTFAFRLREVTRLLLDLGPSGGTDSLGMLNQYYN